MQTFGAAKAAVLMALAFSAASGSCAGTAPDQPRTWSRADLSRLDKKPVVIEEDLDPPYAIHVNGVKAGGLEEVFTRIRELAAGEGIGGILYFDRDKRIEHNATLESLIEFADRNAFPMFVQQATGRRTDSRFVFKLESR